MREHDLKVLPTFWPELVSGEKTFELRFNDRKFQAGDILVLREWISDEIGYTGRLLRKRVTYLIEGGPWLNDGYVCMAIKDYQPPMRLSLKGKTYYFDNAFFEELMAEGIKEAAKAGETV